MRENDSQHFAINSGVLRPFRNTPGKSIGRRAGGQGLDDCCHISSRGEPLANVGSRARGPHQCAEICNRNTGQSNAGGIVVGESGWTVGVPRKRSTGTVKVGLKDRRTHWDARAHGADRT